MKGRELQNQSHALVKQVGLWISLVSNIRLTVQTTLHSYPVYYVYVVN